MTPRGVRSSKWLQQSAGRPRLRGAHPSSFGGMKGWAQVEINRLLQKCSRPWQFRLSLCRTSAVDRPSSLKPETRKALPSKSTPEHHVCIWISSFGLPALLLVRVGGRLAGLQRSAAPPTHELVLQSPEQQYR